MTAYRRPLTTAAVTAAALVLTACNGTGTTEGGTGTTSATPVTVTSTATTNSPAPTTPTTTTGTTTTVSATTAPVDRPLGTPTTASETRTPVMWDEPAPLVTGVRIGRHDTYTRVVYDLVGNGEPGWYSGYIDQPYQDGSGFPVDVQGNAYLMINITGTTYPFEHDAEELAIGPHPGTGVVREVVNTGVFEGNTLTYIGMDEPLPYSVTVLHSPLRVVVDIQHP